MCLWWDTHMLRDKLCSLIHLYTCTVLSARRVFVCVHMYVCVFVCMCVCLCMCTRTVWYIG